MGPHAGSVVLQHTFQQLVRQIVLAGLYVDVRQQQPATLQVFSVLERPNILANALQVIPGARRLLQQDMCGSHTESGSYMISQSLLTGQCSTVLQGFLDVRLLLGGQQEEVAEKLVGQFFMGAALGIQFLQ